MIDWAEQIELETVDMPVIVPLPLATNLEASRALNAEKIAHRTIMVFERLDYARAFATEWRKGQGFILVEHDVIPWPGALAELEHCPEDLCGFRYPLGRAGKIGGTLGCTKFSRELIAQHPELANALDQVPWGELDGRIFALLERDDFHVHGPPVAHLRTMIA